MFNNLFAYIQYLFIIGIVLQQYDSIYIGDTNLPLIEIKVKEDKEKEQVLIMMKTRSQTRRELEQNKLFEIDFDEASKAWRANKIALKNGCFIYKSGKNK